MRFQVRRNLSVPVASRKRLCGWRLETLEGRIVPAVFNVNSLADLANPPAGVVTLRSAISAANATAGSNTINLTVGGTYAITTFGTAADNSAGEFVISGSNNLILTNTSGTQVTVDGGGLNRVFLIDPKVPNSTPTVTFQGLKITGGFDDYGGGMEVLGGASVVLNNTVVFGNRAEISGGGIELGLMSIGTITLNNSQITDNYAAVAGGGLSDEGTGVINLNSQSSVNGNTGLAVGGGIYDTGSTLSLNGATIHGNRTSGSGGGILVQGGNVSLNASIIDNNVSATDGGGYDETVSSGQLTVTNCFFLNNTAGLSTDGGSGGGLLVEGASVSLNHSLINGNTASSGGGADFQDSSGTTPPKFQVNDTLFSSNNGAFEGGAIEDDATNLTLTSCTFLSNRATISGSALDVTSFHPVVQIFNSLFLKNAISSAPVVPGSPVPAGGAISQDAGTLAVFGSQFTANAGVGGAINFVGAGTSSSPPTLLTIQTSTFNGNRSPAAGAALHLYLQNARAVLTNDTIAFNSTFATGGAIEYGGSYSPTLSLINDTINGNTAVGTGGGIHQTSGILTVQNTILAANTGAGTGSDEYMTGGTTTDLGGNLLTTTAGTGNSYPLALVGSPNLGPLQNNGYNGQVIATATEAGSLATAQAVQTEALLPGSLAFGQGIAKNAPVIDERGFNRPGGGASRVAAGAYEPQYASNASVNAVLAENLYEVLLDRVADPGGLGTSVSQLNSGTSPVIVAEGLEFTREYLSDQIAILYDRYLSRTASTAELNFYVSSLYAGHTLESVAVSMLSSSEFTSDYGQNSAVVVDGIYQTSLGRAADTAGAANFLQLLNNGVSRTSVATSFLASTEYFTNLIQADFSANLGRAPEPTAVTFYLTGLQSGVYSQVLMAILLGSTESVQNRT